MTECLNSGRIIVNDKVILLILVVFLVLECEPHPEDSLLRIGVTTVCDVSILVGNLFVILGDEVHLLRGFLNRIADRIGLDEVHRCDQVRDLLDNANQSDLCRPCFHMAAFHLDIQYRYQHFLR